MIRINLLAENHDDYLGMGTTVVCALLTNGQLVVAHVGDSRLYLCIENELVQLTQDDSWAATVLGGKEGNSGSVATRHVLTNVLGARPDTQCPTRSCATSWRRIRSFPPSPGRSSAPLSNTAAATTSPRSLSAARVIDHGHDH